MPSWTWSRDVSTKRLIAFAVKPAGQTRGLILFPVPIDHSDYRTSLVSKSSSTEKIGCNLISHHDINIYRKIVFHRFIDRSAKPTCSIIIFIIITRRKTRSSTDKRRKEHESLSIRVSSKGTLGERTCVGKWEPGRSQFRREISVKRHRCNYKHKHGLVCATINPTLELLRDSFPSFYFIWSMKRLKES